MLRKIYFNLLLFGSILSQGIIGTFVEGGIKRASNFPVRIKRVTDINLPDVRARNDTNAPFLASIRKNEVSCCAGSVMSKWVVLTASDCITGNKSQYKILTTSGHSLENFRTSHSIDKTINYIPSNQSEIAIRLTLVIISTPISYGQRNIRRAISTYEGSLPLEKEGMIFSWGTYKHILKVKGTPRQVHSIEVPIITYEECRRFYGDDLPILDIYFCTFLRHRFCNPGDLGAPFVFDDSLVGVLVHIGRNLEGGRPDVFAYMGHKALLDWTQPILDRTTDFNDPPLHMDHGAESSSSKKRKGKEKAKN